MPDDRKYREGALRRRIMTQERKAEIAAANAKFSDWWGVCRHCGEKVEGTPSQLREHQCGSTD